MAGRLSHLATLPAFVPPERVHAADLFVPDLGDLAGGQQRGGAKESLKKYFLKSLEARYDVCTLYNVHCTLMIKELTFPRHGPEGWSY